MIIEAKLPPEVEESLDYRTLRKIVDKSGRACKISYPSVARRTAKNILSILDGYEVQARVFGAHKATNSTELVAATKMDRFGCDVASKAELESALKAGFAPADIIATGPKSDSFLRKLSNYPEVAIVLDSERELERLIKISQSNNPVLLRLSRSIINLPGVRKLSRFGMDMTGFDRCVERLKQQSKHRLLGVAFHIDTQSSSERLNAFKIAVNKLMQLQAMGFDSYVLDIGGGLGKEIGVTQGQIEVFEEYIMNDIVSGKRQATWLGSSYGLKLNNNSVRGAMTGIDLPGDISDTARLRQLLSSRIDGDKAADILRDNLIELWCEPGGAIYSQSGTVVAEVMESRVLDGNVHVVIDINRFQLGIAGIESPADPIMLSPHDNSGQKPKPERCLLVGNLCAEIDVLHQRFITLPRRPQSGDLIVWANLGAYGSYFSAARAIGHPLAAEYIYEKGEFHVV